MREQRYNEAPNDGNAQARAAADKPAKCSGFCGSS
jgi:hypothetical protein